MTVRIGVLAYEGAQTAAVYGLLDLFEIAQRVHASRPRTKKTIETSRWEEGSRMASPKTPLTALIVPPSLRADPPSAPSVNLKKWMLARYDEGTVLCSVCVGAFLLADLGVLKDRTVTTHWGVADAFTAMHPDIELDTDRLLIDAGDVITAGGLMAWVDLGLELVGRYLGGTTMLETARTLLVDPGGREQRFYATFSPPMTHGDDAILKVQRWLPRVVAEEVTVPMMAKVAGLSHRTLLRRFQTATGFKTSAYVQNLRVARARQLLESTAMGQEEIAYEVGYEDAGSLRKTFAKVMGLTPGEYRRRFSRA